MMIDDMPCHPDTADILLARQSAGEGWAALSAAGLLITTLVLNVVLGNVPYDEIFTAIGVLIALTTLGLAAAVR
jgi:anaerobic C4-dicarboxylate transporter